MNLNVNYINKMIGCDPEIFFVKNNKVIPSSEVVPEHTDGYVIRDGFQGELNPQANTCRQSLSHWLGNSFLIAKRYADDVGAKISLDTGMIISDDVWKKTPKELKRFGCNPTLNSHEKKFKRVTGVREKFRALGGHIHLSLNDGTDEEELVALLDVIVGNTCVLLDRDPNNARRRKNYGRAGEYRVKRYGIEYRVLSAFWMKHYVLMSMVFAFARNAIAIQHYGKAKELLSLFDMRKVRRAINNNDFELAKENFNILMKFIKDNKAVGNGLSENRIDKFYEWATGNDPLVFCNTIEKTTKSWEDCYYHVPSGFERFIDNNTYKTIYD